MRLQSILAEHQVISFLAITFVLSFLSFILMFTVPGAQSPENSTGLPIWLIAIWSPTIAAMAIWFSTQNWQSELKVAFSMPAWSFWSLTFLIPLTIAGVLVYQNRSLINPDLLEYLNWRNLLFLTVINLIMGPMGEELGWRAMLYPSLKIQLGWLGAAIVVGVIWSVWHAPLWLLNSPQSKIPFLAFAANVILLSVLMSMVYNHSHGSILVVILIHLTFNLSLGLVDLLEAYAPGEYVSKSLIYYFVVVIVLVGWHECSTPKSCLLVNETIEDHIEQYEKS